MGTRKLLVIRSRSLLRDCFTLKSLYSFNPDLSIWPYIYSVWLLFGGGRNGGSTVLLPEVCVGGHGYSSRLVCLFVIFALRL